MSKLSFAELRKANASRAPRWHTSPEGMMEWTIGDWFMAMAGETGEGAEEFLPLMFICLVEKQGQLGNMAKKYRRIQEGIANKSADPTRLITVENAISKMFEELADMQIYLDLFALRLREALQTTEDIGDHVETKFNKTSEMYGFPERLIDGKFVLATKGKFRIQNGPFVGAEYEGELYQVPPEPKPITMTLDAADFLADAVSIPAAQAAEDIHRSKYTPETICTIIAPEDEAYFSETLEEDVTFGTVEWVVHDEVQTYKLDNPIALKAGQTYKIGIQNGKPIAFVVPPRPVVWHDGCAKCRWCAMDMDMDPFCTNPEIKKAAGTTIGVGINAAVQTCTVNGLLDKFEPQK